MEPSAHSLSDSPSRLRFQQTYLRTLLPALLHILGTDSFASADYRSRATKFAVDMSLALSAGGNLKWKKALVKDLVTANGRRRRRRSKRQAQRRSVRVTKNGGFKEVERPAAWEKKETMVMVQLRIPKRRKLQKKVAKSVIAVGGRRSSRSSRCRVNVEERDARLWSDFSIRDDEMKRKAWAERSSTRCGEGRDRPPPSCLEKRQQLSGHGGGREEAMEQMRSLGSVIPGGRDMDAPVLLEEAADYLLSLQMQVQALQSLLVQPLSRTV